MSVKDWGLIQDYEFRLTEVNGHVQWAWSSAKKKNQIEIIRMIDEGMKQEDIANVLGVTKGFVSQIKTKAIKDGHLDSHGKLTLEGKSLVNEASVFEGEQDEFSY